MTWFWLSFCDNSRPHGQRFLGACAVQGVDVQHAIVSSWAHGCNPGGEILTCEIENIPPVGFLNRLLDHEQIAEMEAQMQGGGQ